MSGLKPVDEDVKLSRLCQVSRCWAAASRFLIGCGLMPMLASACWTSSNTYKCNIQLYPINQWPLSLQASIRGFLSTRSNSSFKMFRIGPFSVNNSEMSQEIYSSAQIFCKFSSDLPLGGSMLSLYKGTSTDGDKLIEATPATRNLNLKWSRSMVAVSHLHKK